MKRMATLAIGLLAAAALPAGAEEDAPKGPLDFQVRNYEGKESGLADLKGKVVLVDWWASWCGPCRVVIPELIRLQEKYGKEGLQVIGVSVNRDRTSGAPAYETEKKYVNETEFAVGDAKKKINYPIYLYTDEYRDWVIKKTAPDGRFGIPTLVFVNRKGQYASHHVGSGNVKAIETEVKKLLAEKAEEKAEGDGTAAANGDGSDRISSEEVERLIDALRAMEEDPELKIILDEVMKSAKQPEEYLAEPAPDETEGAAVAGREPAPDDGGSVHRDSAQVIAELTGKIEEDPKNPVLYTLRGIRRATSGDREGGMADLNKAIELEPAYYFAYQMRAATRRDAGDLEGAIADVTKSLEIRGANITDLAIRGAMKRDHGDIEGAVADWRAALKQPEPRSERLRRDIDAPMRRKVVGDLRAAGAWALSFTDLDGGEVTLARYHGKIIVLDVWATWCHFCTEEMPQFQELIKEYGADRVAIVTVSDDQGDDRAAQVRAYRDEHGFDYEFLLARPASLKVLARHVKGGRIPGYPTTFVIDQDGQVRAAVVGTTGMDRFRAEIGRLLPAAPASGASEEF